ncbi:hypothetical protein HLVA_11080 [Haliovirga abyssi]|uniref:Ribosome small subunit-dependent GTPase A n=2 Tax=Haliovirga abyssi TaxID=2996794 RepID=A0AAU9D3I5_9FUSO|nr:hypothetical protein HLVA_11080 [Haliovirga abyssi]
MLNLLLLDSFYHNIEPIVVINKIDLLDDIELHELKSKLSFLDLININYLLVSLEKNINLERLKKLFENGISAFGGPSGVGKSSIINILQNRVNLEIGELSNKLKRGKHTTKGATLLKLNNNNGYIIDTPGFSSMELPKIKDLEDLKRLFPEIEKYDSSCRFNDCIHIHEPDCAVKENVLNGNISATRYEFYKKVYLELKTERWNKYD